MVGARIRFFVRLLPVRGFSVYDVVFLAGLMLSVRVMVSGVERERSAGHSVVRTRWAMLAGALTLSGFLGALLTRLGVSSRGTLALVTVGAVIAGVVSARVLVRQAVAMPVSDHEFDPRFELQGVPALVVEAIPADGVGAVRLPGLSGAERRLAARSLDGSPIARDVEVGVERIEDGVAFVEAWSAIEARL
jgi:uncharacterized membrane protein